MNTTETPPRNRWIIIFTILFALVLAIGLTVLLSDSASYEKRIALIEIEIDKPYYTQWHGQTLLILRPNDEFLAQSYDSRINKLNQVVDPPERTSREAFAYKVFLFDRSQSYLMFGFHKWYNNIVPCAAFHYINRPFLHEQKVVKAGFKCSQSLDEFWQDKLVFTPYGRSLSREIPDLYSPYYLVADGYLIVGLK